MNIGDQLPREFRRPRHATRRSRILVGLAWAYAGLVAGSTFGAIVLAVLGDTRAALVVFAVPLAAIALVWSLLTIADEWKNPP